MAGEPRDIIAAALCIENGDDPECCAEIGLWGQEADAVLAALTDAGITLCRQAQLGVRAWYVPVEDTP